MAQATSKGAKQALSARQESRARTPLTSLDAAVCVLLLLTVAGVATEAIELTGAVRLVLLGATALSLLIGFWRPRIWLAVVAVFVVAGGAAAGAAAIKTKETSVLWIAASGVIVAVLGLIAIWVSTLLRRVHRRMREDRRIIEALTQIDPATGAFKPHAGRDRLRVEVARAVRYRRPFTLLVGKARAWEAEVDHRGMSAAQEVYAEILRTAATVLRNNDIIASEPDYSFMVILPETTAEGCECAAQHILEAMQGLLEVRFGLVQCPDDGETEDALLREARQALAFAEMANLPIVSRRSLIADGTE